MMRMRSPYRSRRYSTDPSVDPLSTSIVSKSRKVWVSTEARHSSRRGRPFQLRTMTEKKTEGEINRGSVPTGGPRHGVDPPYCFPLVQARPAMTMSSLFLLGEMGSWRILYRQPHRGGNGGCTALRYVASCLRFLSGRQKGNGKIQILNGFPPEGRMSHCVIDRRRFLKYLGAATGSAVARGAGLMTGWVRRLSR